MQQRDVIALLVGLGAVFTIIGPFIGVLALKDEYRKLDAALKKVGEIARDPNLNDDQKNAQRMEVLEISPWPELEFFRQWVRFYVLKQALSGLGWAAAVTVLGIVLGAIGGIWSLYLPSDAPNPPSVRRQAVVAPSSLPTSRPGPAGPSPAPAGGTRMPAASPRPSAR